MFNYENNYPISTLKSDDIIIIPYSIAELTPQEVVLIICDDGYTELHSSTEVITCVNKDGDKIQQSCEYFEQLGWLGYYLPHKENVNDDVYEFISKITNVRKLKSFYCFKWNDSGLYRDVLSIKIGNIVYKTNLRISNNTLNFGAFDV
jgi:hypothetical protein